MTKTDEKRLLAKFIKDLGTQSYLGPWLAEYQSAIERDLDSDFSPDGRVLMPSAARREAMDIIVSARDEAKTIREQALEYRRGVEQGVLDKRRQIERELTAQLRIMADRVERQGLLL